MKKTIKNRGKKWFKEMSDDEKRRICEHLDIDEASLKRAGHIDDDGKLYIDMLRVSFKEPEYWSRYLAIMLHYTDIITSTKMASEQLHEIITIYIDFMLEFSNEVIKVKKHNISLNESLQINQIHECIIKDFKMMLNKE